MNAEYTNRWYGNRRTVEQDKGEVVRQMEEHFERELVLPANNAQYEVLYALGEVDS